ncbi:MAG: hypothetical protein QXZ62_06740 [Candidatus Caldarchaeum sp.]
MSLAHSSGTTVLLRRLMVPMGFEEAGNRILPRDNGVGRRFRELKDRTGRFYNINSKTVRNIEEIATVTVFIHNILLKTRTGSV